MFLNEKTKFISSPYKSRHIISAVMHTKTEQKMQQPSFIEIYVIPIEP